MPARGATPSRRQPAPKHSVWTELLIARGQLRAVSRIVKRLTDTGSTPDGAARFVMLVVQNRGGFGVLCALDASGQVWERRSTFDSATKATTAEWWEPMGMERRKKGGAA